MENDDDIPEKIDSGNGLASKATAEDTKVGDRRMPPKWLHKVLISLAVIAIIGLTIALAVLGSIKLRRLMRLSSGNFDIKNDVRYERYRYASVAADTYQCSRVGTDILGRDGGTVVDAAIATLLCLGVVHMQSTGIGGGFIMTYYNATEGKVQTLTAREMAPRLRVTQDFLVGKGIRSSHSIGVPMEVAGYWEAHTRYGKLPWKDLFEPAIKLAEEGFNLTEGTTAWADDIRKYNLRFLMDGSGHVLRAGSRVKMPKLAQTLRRIAEGGAREFYMGSLAEEIAQDIRDLNGIVTVDDLNRYQGGANWKNAVKVHLRNGDYTLYSPPPPSSGLALGYIVNIMDEYNLKQEDFELPDYGLNVHRLTEAFKFAFAERAKLGDDLFEDNTNEFVNLQSDEFARRTRHKIKDDRVLNMRQYGVFMEDAFQVADSRGTAHFSILGADGSAASVTGTINYPFGMGRIGRRTGIIFNNELDDFSLPSRDGSPLDNDPNLPAPGKRPISSMVPAIVMDNKGKVKLVIGASGGTKILTGTADAISKALWSNQELGWVVESPRTHHQLKPNVLEQEEWRRLNGYVYRELERKGHKIVDHNLTAIVQAVRVLEDRYCMDGKCLEAASDSRKDGRPDGY